MRFAGSRTDVDFKPVSLQSGASGGNYSAAAGAVDLGNSFAAQREKAPRYDELSGAAMQTQSAEKRAAMEAEASVMSNGIASLGQTKAAQMTAEASIKAAEAEAKATKSAGMMSGFGQIASAGLSLIPGLG